MYINKYKFVFTCTYMYIYIGFMGWGCTWWRECGPSRGVPAPLAHPPSAPERKRVCVWERDRERARERRRAPRRAECA